ncbi:DNA-processing protein DprA [Lacticaseibacillus jixiensis]|uniref:DNA-processing protein DprA n=1 Tax=Lacticaseibacillus jixiensis TaxID=3231926 RepID=UPI0036F3A68C
MLIRDFLFYWQVRHYDSSANTRAAAWRILQHQAPDAQLKPQLLPDAMQASLQDETHLAQARAAWGKTPFITRLDADYPKRLAEAYAPPAVLFYQGDLTLLHTLNLAVVGARQATAYTSQALTQLGAALAQITVVSGLASGADSMAHRFAISHHFPTIAVIATGLDQVYPPAHDDLQQWISQHGLVLSEYPPGVAPTRRHFVERNRIIAGLCHGLLVTEAAMHSGSLITANLALQNNREVFALPGPITAPLAAGSNALLQAGAKLIASGADIMEEINYYW